MLSMTNMNAEQAQTYHRQDQNYYSQNNEIGRWYGIAKDTLGLGEVIEDYKHFERLCHGIHHEKDELIANTKKRAGVDLTFSAPKSVSVLVELSNAQDEQLIRDAHKEAVENTLKHIETYIQTREQINGVRNRIQTSNMLAARFEHDTSRTLDPQLHEHAFVFNFTQKENGEWRALSNEELFNNKMYFGQVYRNQLAENLQKLGYQIEVTDAKMGFFEIKGVSKELIHEFSKRSEEMKEKFEELKIKHPGVSESKLKEQAAIESRKIKDKNIDREKIKIENNKIANEIVDVKQMLLDVKMQTAGELKLSKEQMLERAKEILTEQESVFKKEDLIKESLKLGLGAYRREDFEPVITNDTELLNLENNIFTTVGMIEIEKNIIEDTKAFQNSRDSLSDEIVAQKHLENYTLTKGQALAAKELLTNKDLILNIQGDAGTGKTFMLKTVNDYIVNLQDSKYTLQGLSFTGKAADEIEKESGIKSSTLHSFFNQKEFPSNQIYIVDEASMIGSRQMYQLIEKAKETNSKIVLIGDTKQFQSLSAGGIFTQLQKQEFVKTVEMSESMRAKNDLMKSLYKDIKSKDFENAFKTIENEKLIEESKDLYAIATEYIENEKETLLISSSNKDRVVLNNIIRNSKDFVEVHQISIKENINLYETEKHFANYYKEGQIVFANKPFAGLKAGSEYEIKNVDTLNNEITITNSKNKDVVINLAENGSFITSYNLKEKEFGIGETVIFTKNDKKLDVKNGQLATVTNISNNIMTLTKEGGQEVQIDLQKYNYFDYGYCITDYKSQGQTSKNVMAVVDSLSASSNSFYVQVTRAKEKIRIFTDNIKELKENVLNSQLKTSTLDYNTQEILQRRADELTKIKRIHQSSDREIRGEPNSINLLHKLSNSNLVSDTRKFSDMLLQSDALNNLANRRGRDDNFTVRPTINGVGGITIETKSINNKGYKMQKLHTNIVMKSTGTRAGADMQYWSVGSVDKLNRFTGVIYDQTGNNSASTMFVIGDKVVPSSQFDKEFGLYNYTKEIQKYTDDIYEDRIYSDELGFSYIRENYRANDLAKELAQSSQNFSVVPPIQVGNTLFLDRKNTKSLDKTFMQLAKEFVLEKYYEFGDKFKEKIGQFWGSDKSLSAENVALQSKIKELEIRQAQIEEERKAELRELRKQFQDEKLTEMINMRKEQDVERITKEEKLNNKESFAIKLLVDLYSEFKTDDPSYRWSANHIQEIRQRGERINSIISNASDENKEKIQKYVTNLVNKGIGLYGSETSTYAHIKNGQIEKMQIGKVDEISKKFTGILIENNQVNCFLNNQHVEETELQSNQLGAQALKVFDNIAYINKSGKPKLYEYVQHHLEFKNGNFKGNLYGSGMKVQDTNDLQSNLVDKIPKGDSITWERMMKAHDYINDLSESFKILKDWEDLDLVEEMGGKYDLRNIDYQTFMNFKELAAEVYEDTLKIPNLDFETAMKVAVKASDMFTNNIEEKNTNKHKM